MAAHEGCDCTEPCSMGPTCPGGMLARLPGSGCWRTASSLTEDERERLGFNVQVGDDRWLYDEVEQILAQRLAAISALATAALAEHRRGCPTYGLVSARQINDLIEEAKA